MMITGLDHLVLTVRDPEQTALFYQRVLGMEILRADNRMAVQYGSGKINLHPKGGGYQPHAAHPTRGSADFCLLTEMPIQQVEQRLASLNVNIEQGPVHRSGAAGPLLSLYFRDPDGNLIEIANVMDHYPSNDSNAA